MPRTLIADAVQSILRAPRRRELLVLRASTTQCSCSCSVALSRCSLLLPQFQKARNPPEQSWPHTALSCHQALYSLATSVPAHGPPAIFLSRVISVTPSAQGAPPPVRATRVLAHYLYALTQTNCDPAVSVQLINRQALPSLPADAARLAAALARSRDTDTTNFEPSTVLVDTLCGPDCARPRLNSAEQAGLPEPRTEQLDTGSCLRFEMLTSLVGGGGAASADPSLMRHTLVQVTETSPWVLAVCRSYPPSCDSAP